MADDAKKNSTKKHTPKDVDVKVVVAKEEHSEDSKKECPMLEQIKERTKRRISNLEEMIDDELNPLRRVELEAKLSENVDLMHFLKSFETVGSASKLLKAIFGE